MGLYDDEKWAQLAVKAGFVPEDTEMSARRAFEYSAGVIDQLIAALTKIQSEFDGRGADFMICYDCNSKHSIADTAVELYKHGDK